MNSNNISLRNFVISLVCTTAAAVTTLAQAAVEKERAVVDDSGVRWWYTMAFVGLVLVSGAVILFVRRKKNTGGDHFGFDNRHQERHIVTDYDNVGVDAAKELDWFKKARKSTAKPPAKVEVSPFSTPGRDRRSRVRPSETESRAVGLEDLTNNTKYFQDKIKQLQFSQLPIHTFLQLNEARPFEQLPISADQSLLAAIEQVNEENEEDESVRELVVRILAAFRYRNSVEALTQIALYDLSANLRSKAVTVLTGFDHESVFETILLACADPTREVRAAAARGLFRLSFDRADAWKRLIATKDEFRMKQAARAAIESGIVQNSFDRLLHEDMRIAYEAVALVGMLLKAGEADEVFDAIANHKDERVKFALLHVIKIVKEESSVARLETMSREMEFPDEVARKLCEIVRSSEFHAA